MRPKRKRVLRKEEYVYPEAVLNYLSTPVYNSMLQQRDEY